MLFSQGYHHEAMAKIQKAIGVWLEGSVAGGVGTQLEGGVDQAHRRF
jgi:hypothetical protein